MRVFPRNFRRLLGALGLALACAIPTAYALTAEAAELEGSVVVAEPGAVDPGLPATESPQPNISNGPPPPAVMEEQARALQASEQAMREAEQAMQQQQNWQQEFDRGMQKAFKDDAVFNAGVLIPILAIVFIFGGPILLLVLILIFFFGAKRRRQRDINMNIDKLLAAGRDIPVELLRGDEPQSADNSGSRDKGIRNICLGTGWLIFLTIMVGFDVGSAGFIWIALGISQVVIWYLNQPKAGVAVPQVELQD